MDEAKLWRDRIEWSGRIRKGHQTQWDKFRKDIAGRNYRDGFLTREAQPLNLHNNFVRVVMPHLVPRDANIEVAVTPRRPGPEYAAGAEKLADGINALLPQIRFINEAREAVRMGLYSAGILKVGQNARTGIVTDIPSEKAHGAKVTVDVDLERAEAREWLDPGLPYVCAVRPSRFYNDPDGEWLDQCRWVAHEFYRTIESVKADPRFAKYKDQIKANAAHPEGVNRDKKSGGKGSDPQLSYLKGWELYDRPAGRVRIVCAPGSGCDDHFLDDFDWPAGIEGFPFSMMVYEHVEGEFWPNPPMSPNYDGRTAAEVVVQTIAESAKEAKKIVLYDSNQVKPDQVSSVAKARNGDVIGIPGLSQHVRTEEFGGVQSDQYGAAAQLKALVDEMDGIDSTSRGTSQGDKTATEVQSALALAGVRMDDLKGACNEMLGDASGKVGALILAFQAAYADVLLPLQQGGGRELIALGQGVAGEYLDYLFEIVPTSTDRVDPAIKQKRTQDMLVQSTDANLAAKLQSEGKAFLTAPFLEQHLRNIGERNPAKYLIDLGPAGADAAAKAQAEDQEMLETGQPVPVSPDDDHAAELEVHDGDYQQTQSEAIALHIMEHVQYLEAAGSAGAGGPPQMPGGEASPTAGLAPPADGRAAMGRMPVRPMLGGSAVAAERRAAVA